MAIWGPLRSGKRYLIRGIVEATGAEDSQQVNSPSFVTMNEYTGPLDLYHIDACRLESAADVEMLGLGDYCYPDSVVLIEWEEKVTAVLLQSEWIRVWFEQVALTQRVIHFENVPEYIVL